MKHLICSLAVLTLLGLNTVYAEENCHELQSFSATKLRSSTEVDFCKEFRGKAMLLVNTASQCGYTPQFKGLEKLHKEYGDRLAIVGFPSNDFKQEHDDTKKVADVCYVNYGVTFTMLEPSHVKGSNANALFKKLADVTGQEPGWNFNKYLVSVDGRSVTHFPSNVTPASETLRKQVKSAISGTN